MVVTKCRVFKVFRDRVNLEHMLNSCATPPSNHLLKQKAIEVTLGQKKK